RAAPSSRLLPCDQRPDLVDVADVAVVSDVVEQGRRHGPERGICGTYQGRGVSHEDQQPAGPGERHVGAAELVEESDAPVRVAPGEPEDDEVAFTALERVDGADSGGSPPVVAEAGRDHPGDQPDLS